MTPVSRATAPHYVWKDICDGWRLVDRDDLSVIHERMPPGTAEDRHLHDRARQVFFVLSGSLTIDGATVRPGEALEVPPGTPHLVVNTGPDPTEFLVISAPSTRGDRRAQ